MKHVASGRSKVGQKTTTLLDLYDAPAISLLEGHHTIESFNKAFRAEGWEIEPWPQEYISHEYWIRDQTGVWTCSNKNDLRAIPVTVCAWDGPPEKLAARGPAPHLH